MSTKSELTYATGMVRPKTTALFFDKIWVPDILSSPFIENKTPHFFVPREICIEDPKGVIRYERALYANTDLGEMGIRSRTLKSNKIEFKLSQFLNDIGMIVAKSVEQRSYPHKKNLEIGVKYRDDRDPQLTDPIDSLFEKATTINRNQVIKELVTEYKKEGIDLTPIYLTPTKYDKRPISIFRKMDGLEICLDFIPDILEEKLTWEQVLEFREDKKAKSKLNRLRRWFKIELLSKNEEEIKNTLGQKLDDYQWALKKHGIETIIGGSTSVMTFVSGPPLLNLLTESPLAMLSGGVAIGAGAIAWVGKKIIEKTEIKRNPVAYIYEVRKLEQ